MVEKVTMDIWITELGISMNINCLTQCMLIHIASFQVKISLFAWDIQFVQCINMKMLSVKHIQYACINASYHLACL